MMDNERKKTVTQRLAALVKEVLIAEVTSSLRLGLVDVLDAGAHPDMDYVLFLKSTKTLTPLFGEMAQIVWHHATSQELRERIAEIGREAEKVVLIATNGINTHRGAVWAMGLLISVVAQKVSMGQPFSLPKIFSDVSKLAALSDIKYRHKKTTHGHRAKQEYGVDGAYEEAILGYPHIRLAIQAVKELDNDSYVQKQVHVLLVLMSSLDDTCVSHHNDQKTLAETWKPAHTASRSALPNHPFTALLRLYQENQVSPGGSADLLSANSFMLKIEELRVTDTYICPMLLND